MSTMDNQLFFRDRFAAQVGQLSQLLQTFHSHSETQLRLSCVADTGLVTCTTTFPHNHNQTGGCVVQFGADTFWVRFDAMGFLLQVQKPHNES